MVWIVEEQEEEMAKKELHKCLDCGKVHSIYLNHCPHCGSKLKSKGE